MIENENKENCCGCTACKNICPKNAIEMKEDEEGFLYPNIDKEKCIDCGLCKKVCPIINKVPNKPPIQQEAYVVNNKNVLVRKQSTSGGAFTAIAEYVIKNNGIVYGASFDNNFNVQHNYTTNINDLQKFRGSKYVQSDVKNTFREVRDFLNAGKMICYSGTPCQIEGLKKYLGKEYENLITVDVVCHAVPSPLVWRKYLHYQKKKLKMNNIIQVLFRDKSKYGYKYSTMTIKADNKIYQAGVETDPFLRAFFEDLSVRPSCYNCQFKKQYRVSDFTIWDCFEVEKFDNKLDDDKGTSRILIHTKKGKKVFDEISNQFDYKKIDVDDIVQGVKEMYFSVSKNQNRENFFKDINQLEEEEFFNKYFPDNIKVKVERTIRKVLAKLGIYNKIKKVAKRILRKN